MGKEKHMDSKHTPGPRATSIEDTVQMLVDGLRMAGAATDLLATTIPTREAKAARSALRHLRELLDRLPEAFRHSPELAEVGPAIVTAPELVEVLRDLLIAAMAHAEDVEAFGFKGPADRARALLARVDGGGK
jgi:hypothetical protein